MSTYAIIFLTLSFLTLIGKVSSHGKERPCYNGYAGLIDFIFANWLLYAGGFYDIN